MENLNQYGYREEFQPFGDPDVQDPDPQVRRRFYGKYRGTVVDNVDPLGQNRLMVTVSDVLGLYQSSWALPCVPFTGVAMGVYLVPVIGSRVWVEFEQGDPDSPIWVGGFWDLPHETSATAQASQTAAAAGPVIDLSTVISGVTICDEPVPPYSGQISLHVAEVMITLTEDEVRIVAPTVTITAPEITLNGDTTINGITTINGETAITGDTTISGETILDGDVTVVGAAEVGGAVNIGGAADIEGEATVLGDTNLGGAVIILGGLLVDGIPLP